MGKKTNIIEKTIQAIATIILFILVFFMMHYVSDIQGTARVVNYTGLVRGETQRVVKLEIAGIASQQQIAELDEYVDGVQNGSSSLQLIKIDNPEYQAKVTELSKAWVILKQEISLVRQQGYQNTNIVALSEDYFKLADEMVDEAEKYSQQCAAAISNIETGIDLLIILLVGIMVRQSLAAIKMLRLNRELKKKAYWDDQTNMPNKNECERLLNNAAIIIEPTTCFMFDLNNLKQVNDTLGHDAGDQLILNFSQFIRNNVPESFFVGRYGGDEFIVIMPDCAETAIREILASIKGHINEFNKVEDDIPISYAVGYAKSTDFESCTLRILLSSADKNMYINKKQTKQELVVVQKQLDDFLMDMINALGRAYMDCCYCNVKTGRYRLIKNSGSGLLPDQGDYMATADQIIQGYVCEDDRNNMQAKFMLNYVVANLSEENQSYSAVCHTVIAGEDRWWRITAMFVDNDAEGKLSHFIIAFEENTSEMELEYKAKHDGLTGLLNKTTAFGLVDHFIEDNTEMFKTMLVFDLDNFKYINDIYGHSEGDFVIAEAARLISAEFRRRDIIARFGGDEFFVFLPNMIDENNIAKKAATIIDKVSNKFKQKYSKANVTLSIGIVHTDKPLNSEQLFLEADKALYEAKNKGKNCYVMHNL